jgi:multidrug efflux pump subunit AcrA (membrane-fusion protein)
MGLFFSSVGQYKSSWYETARNLFQSRNTQRARSELLAQENRELRLRNEQLSQDSQETKQQLEQARQLLQQQQQANEELRQRPITLPSDLALPNHTYGPKMISLCLNLCKEIGFRPTATALKIVFHWLGLDVKIPSFESMRVWS